jgi:hypothetical protein
MGVLLLINVDKHAAPPKAFNELKAGGYLPASCELRQVKDVGGQVALITQLFGAAV